MLGDNSSQIGGHDGWEARADVEDILVAEFLVEGCDGTSGQLDEELIVFWCGDWELDFGERSGDFG